jgi:hypothetical protein
MTSQHGMATLLAATSLVLISGMLGWLTCQSVSSEITRSQQQWFAAQALTTSEALIETAMAKLDLHYATLGPDADSLFWLRASPAACPATKSSPDWQCLSWPLVELPLPEFIDPLTSKVIVFRDSRQSPQVATLWVDASLNSLHAGSGSRATLQQSVILPLPLPSPTSASTAPNNSTPNVTPRLKRLAGSWKNAGF